MRKTICVWLVVLSLTQLTFADHVITSSQIQIDAFGMVNPVLPITGQAPWDFTDQDYLGLNSIDRISVTLTLLDGDTDSGEYDEGELVLQLDRLNTGLALDGFASDVTIVRRTVDGVNNSADLLKALHEDGKLLGSILDLSPNDNYVRVRAGYIATLTLIEIEDLSPLDTLYVDDDAVHDPGPGDVSVSDPDEDGSSTHPFDSIQEAIDAARDHVRVLVRGGRYWERLDFRGKPIEVNGLEFSQQSLTPYPVIDAGDQGGVVTFNQGEDANSILSGFVLTRGYSPQGAAILCDQSSPTIQNCLIVGNRCIEPNVPDPIAWDPAVISCWDSQSRFDNCTMADNYGGSNGAGLSVTDCNVVLSNSILWGNAPQQIRTLSGNAPVIQSCCLETDPAFALPGTWIDAHAPDPVAVDPNAPDAIWLDGDYHLQSLHGRYDPHVGDWAHDEMTSACIDQADPNRAVGRETAPHGDRLNVGAYGGTWMASRTGELAFVPISEPGFTGEVSKYEVTNAQYCRFLNATLAEGLVMVHDDRVYGASDISHAGPFFETHGASVDSQIAYANGSFFVRTRDGLSMANHPVVEVSWYGATAFGIYYGYRLPTSDEWKAVADYDGSFVFGCGPTIDPNQANYDQINPLGLTSEPYTSPVGYYPASGYGLCDLAGNVWEWTKSASGHLFTLHSGDWSSLEAFCTVTSTRAQTADATVFNAGFRVCR